MNYWLCITTEENWNVIKRENIWGVAETWRNTIQKVRPGDKVVIYVMQTRKDKEVIPSRITGVFEVISEPFKDSKRIFKSYKSETTFPYRVKLKPLKIFKKPLFFKELVPELKFIKNKRFWSGSLRRAMAQIGERDYNLIVRKGKEYE